ncbi:MAG TPA: methyl-accepting chemotaxis protein, partial [candidate division Zixibacteria bacterium]|nr:methyl-accepting chemotaxis protein [candidate division Zixibacteria bacterium]
MKNLSIRIKVSALLGLVLVVVFGLTIINTRYGQRKAIDRLCWESGREFRAALSQSVEFMMLKGANDELQPALENMVRDSLAKEITIVDFERKIARSSSKTLLGQESNDPIWNNVFASEGDTSFETTQSGEPVLVTYRAFASERACQECHDQGVIGGMKIVKSLKATDEVVASSTRNNLLLAIVSVLVISLGIVIVLNRNIFSPLGKVQKALRLASNGNIHQDVRTDSTNEIGSLLGSIQDLIAYLRRFAAHAQAVAAGNLTDDVEVSGSDDVLGNAFGRMLSNLTDIIKKLTDNTKELA